MLKDLECIYCDTKFSVKTHPNFSVICPCCKRRIYLECEYGYGPVTPCQIYLGEEIVGIVDSDSKGTSYFLNMNTEKINLNKTYLEAIYEAEEVIKKHLKIFHPSKKLQILIRGGNLCFYGDWLGRPYVFHKIVSTYYDDEILEIKFDNRERLIIYEPENIMSTEHELKILNAKRIKWMYIPYGANTSKYATIIYTAESEKFSKETKYGIEHQAIKEPFVAVYLG